LGFAAGAFADDELGAAITVLVALPLSLLITRYRWLSVPVMGTLGTLYTVPSLALIILVVPLFGLNSNSVVVAMAIYAQVILVRNITVGLQSINQRFWKRQSMGMNLWQRWWRVQVPLILPYFLAGLRLAVSGLQLQPSGEVWCRWTGCTAV